MRTLSVLLDGLIALSIAFLIPLMFLSWCLPALRPGLACWYLILVPAGICLSIWTGGRREVPRRPTYRLHGTLYGRWMLHHPRIRPTFLGFDNEVTPLAAVHCWRRRR